MISKTNIRNNILPAVVLLLLSIAVIFYQFITIPGNLHVDEVEFAALALSLRDTPYIPYSPLATGHATLYFYIILGFFNIFGVNEFALRLPSAIAGVISPVIFFFIFKLIFKEKKYAVLISFLLAFMFLTLRWYFNFARFSFEATFLTMLELFSLLFLLYYREKKKYVFLILSGVFAGLAYNSYTPGRLFVALPIIYLLIDIFSKSRELSFKNLKPLTYFLVPFLILITPITIYLSQNRDIRVYQLFMVMNDELSIQQKIVYLWQNIVNTAGMFHVRGDVNGVHNFPNKPALNPFVGAFFILGLVLSLIRWKNSINILFLIYFGLSLLPTTLVYPWENPHMLRTYTAIPAVVYFAGVGMIFIAEKLKRYLSLKLIYAGFAVMILLSAMYEMRTYFLYQSLVLEESFRARKGLEYHLKHGNVTDLNEETE